MQIGDLINELRKEMPNRASDISSTWKDVIGLTCKYLMKIKEYKGYAYTVHS